MMIKSIVLSIALIALLIGPVVVSGCTNSPAATATATPAASAAPASGVTPASLFDHSRFAWYQYEITSGMGMSMTHTYKYDAETLNGQQASHVNITMDMLPGMLAYLDIWTDPSGGNTLKIHEVTYENGNLTKDADIDAANYTRFEGDDLASPKFTTASLPASGSDTVTVDNKSYTTTRYTGASGSENLTYWVSKDVPVPVKFVIQDGNDETTYELKGWGADLSLAPSVTLSASSGSMSSGSMSPGMTMTSTPSDAKDATLVVNGSVQSPGSFSYNDLVALGVTHKNLTETGMGMTSYVDADTVPLNSLLAKVRPAAGATNIEFIGSDGFTATIPLANVTADRNTVIALTSDKGLLDCLPNESSMNWVHNLVTITVS